MIKRKSKFKLGVDSKLKKKQIEFLIWTLTQSNEVIAGIEGFDSTLHSIANFKSVTQRIIDKGEYNHGTSVALNLIRRDLISLYKKRKGEQVNLLIKK